MPKQASAIHSDGEPRAGEAETWNLELAAPAGLGGEFSAPLAGQLVVDDRLKCRERLGAAQLADEDAFWKLYGYYFENQQELTPENIKEKSLEVLAGTKVDTDKWGGCYDNKETLDQVKADMAEGQSVGVTGTPAFLINGP